MRVGIVDVGSNTVRLVVFEQHGRVPVAVRGDRVMLGLGADVEQHGKISERKLAEVESCVRRFAKVARREGAGVVEALVTSPGRQAANGIELVERLTVSAGIDVRLLSAEDEGVLAFEGATRGRFLGWRSVAVCDVGGGSTQIAVGESGEPPSWVRSIDIGSLRLTRRLGAGRPDVAEALDAARGCFEGLAPPLPEGALAVGGSARAVRRIAGRTLGVEELATAREILARRPRKEIVRIFGVEADRARTLVAGAAILSEVQRRLGVPLRVVRGGVREGAAVRLLAQLEAAA
jgi:exopolyphosphatase / guanosine-5'-triphosphate,3'-diphosphate pyrophosphatase